MLRSPKCPYCNRKFLYREIIKLGGIKKLRCKNCKNVFKISSFFRELLFLFIVIVVLVFVNIYLISHFEFKGILPMLTVNIICVSLSFLLMPFTMKFKKIKKIDRRK